MFIAGGSKKVGRTNTVLPVIFFRDPLSGPPPPSASPASVAKSSVPPFELQIPARAAITSPPPVFKSNPSVAEVQILAARGRLVPLRSSSARHRRNPSQLRRWHCHDDASSENPWAVEVPADADRMDISADTPPRKHENTRVRIKEVALGFCRVSAKLLHPRCILRPASPQCHEWPREPLRSVSDKTATPTHHFLLGLIPRLAGARSALFFRPWASLSDSTA